MKKYELEISQNSCEYIGFVYIECNLLIRHEKDVRVVYADGVRIEFDEEILNIKEK